MTRRRIPDTSEESEDSLEATEGAELGDKPADFATQTIEEIPAKPMEPAWSRPSGEAHAGAVGESGTMLENVDRDFAGLTVTDGFRFGCGFALALAIGTLAFLVVVTAIIAVGVLIGFKPPF